MSQVENIEVREIHDQLSEPNVPEMPTAEVVTELQPEVVNFESALPSAPTLEPSAVSPVHEASIAPSEEIALESESVEIAEHSAALPDESLASSPVLNGVVATEAPASPVEHAAISAILEPVAPTQTPEELVEHLEIEVNAAPHKVYSLGKVRRARAELKASDAGESFNPRIDALEASILGQVADRKAAKEAICEQAEGLRESNEWRVTGDKLRGLFEEWKLIGGAGKKLDDQLWQRFINAREHFSKRRTEHFEERQKVWAVAKVKKEELIAEAETLGASSDWRSTADKIRSLQDQWRLAGSAGRDADDTLWNRFNTAKQAFFDSRTAVWDANKQLKEELCLEAEALKASDDWRLTGDAMKAMQTRWKEIGSAGKAAEDHLWERFRAATNAFFERREGAFAGKRLEERDNLAKKLELVTKAEALLYTGDGLSAAREAKDLQAQWKSIGHASREQGDALWTRFRTACDRIFESASSERDRQQGEWHLRMKEAMTRKREQLASTRESIVLDEANLTRWRTSLSESRPGPKAADFEAGLDAKILDVINRIRAKQERVEDLRATIADMEAKLRD